MGISSRLYLLAGDGTLHALASAAFMRMLRQEDAARLPDFAGQRVRAASLVVEAVNRVPLRVLHSSFLVLDIDQDGRMDVQRLQAQQFARVDDLMRGVWQSPKSAAPVIDATSRFAARGGSWVPDEALRRRIEALALGRLNCGRVRVAR